MRYKALGNGACLENSTAVHVFEDEKQGKQVKTMINNHMADNWEAYYKHKVSLPYREVDGVGHTSKVVELKTDDEMVMFLRSKESLEVFSNYHELLVIANVFDICINIQGDP